MAMRRNGRRLRRSAAAGNRGFASRVLERSSAAGDAPTHALAVVESERLVARRTTCRDAGLVVVVGCALDLVLDASLQVERRSIRRDEFECRAHALAGRRDSSSAPERSRLGEQHPNPPGGRVAHDAFKRQPSDLVRPPQGRPSNPPRRPIPKICTLQVRHLALAGRRFFKQGAGPQRLVRLHQRPNGRVGRRRRSGRQGQSQRCRKHEQGSHTEPRATPGPNQKTAHGRRFPQEPVRFLNDLVRQFFLRFEHDGLRSPSGTVLVGDGYADAGWC